VEDIEGSNKADASIDRTQDGEIWSSGSQLDFVIKPGRFAGIGAFMTNPEMDCHL